MTKDLGTFYVRVEFESNGGFLYKWTTDARYTGGDETWHPLDAHRTEPLYETADDVFHAVSYMFTEGNYCCDCNLRMFMDRANGCEKEYDDDDPNGDPYPCGHTMKIKRLSLIHPDGSSQLVLGELISTLNL